MFALDSSLWQACVDDAIKLKQHINTVDALEYGVDYKYSLEKYVSSASKALDALLYSRLPDNYQNLFNKYDQELPQVVIDHYLQISTNLTSLAEELFEYENTIADRLTRIDQTEKNLANGKARWEAFAKNTEDSCGKLKESLDKIEAEQTAFLQMINQAPNADELEKMFADAPALNFDDIKAHLAERKN